MFKKTIINLPPYCDGCADIKPKAEVTETVDMFDDDVKITCSNIKKCERLKRYLSQKQDEGLLNNPNIDTLTGEVIN